MFDIDYQTASQIVSLVASIVAMGSTLYFWLIRSNRERPDLAIEVLTDLNGRVLLGQEHPEAFRALRPAEEEVVAAYWLDVAVVNNSLLPNAILAVSAEMKLANGKWKSVNARIVSETSIPVNLPPLITAGLSLEFTTNLVGDLSKTTGQQRVEMARSALGAGVPIRLRFKGVRNVTFEFQLNDSPVANPKPALRVSDHRQSVGQDRQAA